MGTSSIENHTCDLKIASSGNINGVRFDAQDGGQGDAATGRFCFYVNFSAIPTGIDPFANLLSILILPTVVFSREISEAKSLMTLANGVFYFTQMARGKNIAASSHGKFVKVHEREFLCSSTAEGIAKLDNVTAIESCEAVMIPQGFGKMIEVISLPSMNGFERSIVQLVRQFTFTSQA